MLIVKQESMLSSLFLCALARKKNDSTINAFSLFDIHEIKVSFVWRLNDS